MIPAMGEIVTVGPGSYTSARPAPCKPLPEKIHRTENFKGAPITNQWWSSLLFEDFSSNLFAHPLGMVATNKGLAVTHAGHGNTAGKDAIMGTGVSHTGDFVISHGASKNFQSSKADGHRSPRCVRAIKLGKSPESQPRGVSRA